MLTVLFVLSAFPPVGGAASVRMLKPIKYLSRCGVRTLVVTPRPNTDATIDPSLMEDVPSDCTVVRVEHGGRKFRKAVEIYRAVRRIMRQNSVDWLVTSTPPEEYHKLGYLLTRGTTVRWHCDLQEPFRRGPWGMSRRFNQGLCSRADLITTAWPCRDMLPDQIADRSHCAWIPYGFDPENHRAVPAGSKSGELTTFVHFGTLHAPRQDPTVFLDVLGSLKRVGNISSENCRFRFLGPIQGNTLERKLRNGIRHHGLENIVELAGYVPHQRGLADLRNADVGVVFHRGFNLSSKVFDYLGARCPLLVYYPLQTPLWSLLREQPGVRWVEYGNRVALRDTIARWVDRPIGRGPDPGFRNRFSQTVLTQRLLEFYEGGTGGETVKHRTGGGVSP